MYLLQFPESVRRALHKLDRSVSARILRKLNWLATNAEGAKPEGLRGDMAGYSKLREGDYRVVYEIRHDDKVILIHSIGHRSDIYKDR